MPVDIAMPRDLVRRRKNSGFAAICAVGIEGDESLFRLATAENVEAHVPALQVATWHHLHLVRVVWTPGMAVARTIVVAAEKFLTTTGFLVGNHWYRADLGILDDLVRAEAFRLRAETWTQPELLARLRSEAHREADRFAEGRF